VAAIKILNLCWQAVVQQITPALAITSAIAGDISTEIQSFSSEIKAGKF